LHVDFDFPFRAEDFKQNRYAVPGRHHAGDEQLQTP
jgi:hypothetical protein